MHVNTLNIFTKEWVVQLFYNTCIRKTVSMSISNSLDLKKRNKVPQNFKGFFDVLKFPHTSYAEIKQNIYFKH